METYNTGIALGGGGTRGFAHLGVLQALAEGGIRPEIISGVSAGAIVGAFLADGKSPRDIHLLLKDKGLFSFSKMQMSSTGLLNLKGLKSELKSNLSVSRLEDLTTPLVVGAANLSKGQMEYFSEGPIEQAVLASSSIPILFSPVQIGESLYVDGGLMDNLPVQPLRGRCQQIIGVNICPVAPTDRLNNMLQIALRIFQLNLNSKARQPQEYCDLVIEPRGLEKYDYLTTSAADELFELGYQYAAALLKEAPLELTVPATDAGQL
jgi:NTE family protein